MIVLADGVENRTRSVPKGITTLERGNDIKADAQGPLVPRLWRPRQAIHVDPPRTGVAQ